MQVKILGNGGALNDGLPYNAFMVNDTLLCEVPPDIMLSLNRNDVDISSIDTIYISHLHGDHIFGLPFLILSACFQQFKEEQDISFNIVGPEGIEKVTEELMMSAFTSEHICFEWMKRSCQFLGIDTSSKPDLVEGYRTSIFKLDHMIETFGFSLTGDQDCPELAYIADTRWCDAIPVVLANRPRVVLIDLNGKDDDPEPVHLSLKELLEKALPITGEETRYYGTHLKEEFTSPVDWIQCATPGMVISI